MPVTATRRFVLGTAVVTAATARVATLLQPPVADPYVGGRVLHGRGTATTVLDPTDDAFGARGDGIVLGDLTVQAGSTTVSSATGPFTAHDAGKLVVWRGVGNAVGSGTVASVQSATRVTLTAPASVSSQQDGGPNTNGAVGTDNTRALNRAFAAAQAAAAEVAADRRRQVPAVEVHIPRGVFLLSALQPFQMSGVLVTGEGRFTTVLASVSDGAWLQLSTFDASPSNAYGGTATDWSFQDLQFMNPAFGNGSSEGHRTGRAVQDNGSGGVRLLGCQFTGLSYGFCGAYGSDFSEIRESTFSLCDTGFYFGPGSQQLEISKTDATQCREGAVFEGAPQWHLGGGSSFEDPSVAAITIEGPSSGSTRLGVPVTVQGAFYSGKFLIDGATWFETNSGGNGRTCPRMIWVRGDGPFGVPVQGVTVRDAFVIAGGDPVKDGTNSFLELDTARVADEPVLIDGLVIGGTFFNAVFRMSGSAATSNPRLVAVTRPDGVSLTLGRAGGAKVLEPDGSLRWGLRIQAPTAGIVPLSLQQLPDQAETPLLATRSADSADALSGIAAGGALLDAFHADTSAGGTLAIDADRANHCAVTLTGGRVVLAIEHAPATTSQRLVVELVARSGARTVTWPSDCRFAGSAPDTVAAGSRTTVTFSWNPVDRVWVETARTTGVAA